MKRILFIAALAIATASCLAQEDFELSSNNSIQEQIKSSTSVELLPAYEVTLDDLVMTEWRKGHFDWAFTRQALNPIYITLQNGQDLIVHINKVSHLIPVDQDLEKGDLYINQIINDWGGWNNYFTLLAPLCQDSMILNQSSNPSQKEESLMTLHYKNQHSGKQTLEFLYCISGNDREETSHFNKQLLIVTIQ